ncbi:hypothetical protein HMI54_005157 [Coelomomyces lativittatus]|nr:hypothetical protein HMI54_005157 [Coelomomyces lativittatus]
MLRFKEALQKQNLELYFSAVWTFLHKQLEGIVINDLILKGEQSLTSISSTFSTLTHVSPQVLDQLQTVTKTLLEQLQPLCLDTLTPVPSRVAEYELTLSIPSDHLEYEWHVNFSDKLMVGHPIPCSITISHHHASWVEQDNVDKPLVLHYDFDLASEMWLVIGAKRRQFTLNKASTISFEFSLVPVVSGNLLLPSIQFYPDLSTSSLPQRSISFQTSIQSLSNWFKSGQTTGSSSTFSVTKIGSQSHSLTIQPELVWTVVVVGNNVIGVQKKNMSTQSLPSELKLGSTLDLRRTSHFSPVVV